MRDIIGMLGVVVFVVSFTFLISYFFGTPYFLWDRHYSHSCPVSACRNDLGTGLMTAPGPETFPLRYATGESIRARLLSHIPVPEHSHNNCYRHPLQPWLSNRTAHVSLTFSITLIMFLIITGSCLSRSVPDWTGTRSGREETEGGGRRAQGKRTETKNLADFTYDWDYWIGTDKQLLYITPSCERVTGYSSSEFYARPELMELILHPDDKDRYIAHTSTYQENSGPGEIEFRIVTKEGNIRWIGHRCQQVYDNYGNQIGRRGSNRDITDKRLLKRSVRRS